MMNYDLYKKMAYRDVAQRLKDRYPDAEISEKRVTKENAIYDCISFHMDSGEDNIEISPSLYLNVMYDSYCNTGDYEASLEDAIKLFESNQVDRQEAQNMLENVEKAFGDVENHIFFQLLNKEANREMLFECPHIIPPGMEDLAIIFRIEIKRSEGGIQSVRVTNKDLERGRVSGSPDELFKMALKSTPIQDPVTVTRLRDVQEIMTYNFVNPDDYHDMDDIRKSIDELDELADPEDILIISNKSGICGAGSILYEGVLDKLEEKAGGGLYILPSSRHEVLVMPMKGNDLDTIACIVSEVNMSAVRVEDRLSYNVYKYEGKTLSIAHDSKNRDIRAVKLEGFNRDCR